MKIKAIIYNSKYGSSKAYAKLFASIIKVPTFSLKEAKFNVLKDEDIIYFTYIENGEIKNYDQVNALYQIKAIALTHILDVKIEIDTKLFLLKGNFDYHQLSIFDKLKVDSRLKQLTKVKYEISKDDLENLLNFYYYS